MSRSLRTEEVRPRDLLKLGCLVGIPAALVMYQPDFGNGIGHTSRSGRRSFDSWDSMALLGDHRVGGRAHAAVGWYFLKDYQRARLVTFLDPSGDPRGAGYQVIQSKIAVGDGGVWGRGVIPRHRKPSCGSCQCRTRISSFRPLPRSMDSWGVVVVLGLYFLLLMQIVQNARAWPRIGLGMYVCMGVAALLLFHVLVNVGMVVGRMPVTGIPLPLMSSGGSNTFSVFMMLGLVNNVRLRRFVS